MTFNATRVVLTAVSVSGSLVLTSSFGLAQTQPADNSVVTTFHCVHLGSSYATVAKRGQRTTTPIITWTSKAFGPQFSPQRRCEVVSQRLTQAVAANGGKLRYLRLASGEINNTPVICYIHNLDEKCNDNNLLLTLNQSDRGKEREILQQLVSFGVSATGPSLIRGRTIVNIGIEVDNALVGGNAVPSSSVTIAQPRQPAPAPTPEPVVRPSTVPSATPSKDTSL